VTAVLEPAVVAAIDDLELAARVIVDGIRTGGHRSPLQGHGAEFQQHRPYRAGDDLKYLDWKVFGRSDRLYTRQFRETTNMHLMLVLDASASDVIEVLGKLPASKAGARAVKSLGVLAQQAGLGELVTVAGGQGHNLIGAVGSQHMGLQVAVGMDQRSKGPNGIDRHGKQGSQSQAD
jgi:uncharacterized protein (DUF58 family)